MTSPWRPTEPSCVVTTTSTSLRHKLRREDAAGVARAVDQHDAAALRDRLVGQPEQRRDADAAADEQQVLAAALARQRVAAAQRPPGVDAVAGLPARQPGGAAADDVVEDGELRAVLAVAQAVVAHGARQQRVVRQRRGARRLRRRRRAGRRSAA